MALKVWLRQHWKAGFFSILGLLLAKAIDHIYDLGWFGLMGGLLVKSCTTLVSWLGSSIAVPIWLLLPVLALASLPVAQQIQSRYREQVQPLATPAPLPVVPILNTDQRRVLQAISAEIEKQRGFPSFADLKKETEFTHLVTEGALDVLEDIGFMQWAWDRLDVKRATLTPAGRAYLLSPEISSGHWNN